MLDLETLSTRTNAAVVQIAAIAFDPRVGDDPAAAGHRTFNKFVRDIPDYCHVDPRTVSWWMQQQVAPSLGKKIETTGCSLLAALDQFCDWYVQLGQVEALWSHGATFDIPIVAYHCEVLGLKVPWSYRAPRDTRTLYSLAPGGMPAAVGYGGALTHDALYDCEIQIKQVLGALAALRGVTQ